MSTADRLMSEVLALAVPERAKLAHCLLESLEAGSNSSRDLDAAWLAELESRACDIASGSVTPIPWQTAREDIVRELRKRREARPSS